MFLPRCWMDNLFLMISLIPSIFRFINNKYYFFLVVVFFFVVDFVAFLVHFLVAVIQMIERQSSKFKSVASFHHLGIL
jgi:hypothetical protein